MRFSVVLGLLVGLRISAPVRAADTEFDLLLKNGQVIDPKSGTKATRDVAIANGKIAAIGTGIAPARAHKVVDVSGLIVAPGLIDLHAHVFSGGGLRGSMPVPLEQSVFVDAHAPRSCITTAVDAGTTGWRNFPKFKETIIDNVQTRVLAWLDIVGAGQAGGETEQNMADMDPKAAAEMVKRFPQTIIGIKTAHFRGPQWIAVDNGLEAAKQAGVPLMVDFGLFRPERPFEELVTKRLRPGDIYTHAYVFAVPMFDDAGHVRPYLFEAQKRGVKFDLGHGMGSFLFRLAIPAIRQGFVVDSLSTDMHTGSMNAGMKDLMNVMSKFMAIGRSLDDVILRATWNPAQEMRRPDLGNLTVGGPADVAVIKVDNGKFGFVDVYGTRIPGTKRLSCELTLRDGKVVYDQNGITRPDWSKLGKYGPQSDARWDATFIEQPPKPPAPKTP